MTTPGELGPAERERWETIRRQDTAFASPFFSFAFTEAVAAVRRDVRVAVLRRPGGAIVGFFPFQVSGLGAGRPVGGKLSDYHGVVVSPDVAWDVPQLLRLCGLRSLRFDHLIAAQGPFRPFFRSLARSPVVDFDDPAKPPPRLGGEAGRKLRRLERRAHVRFEYHERSEASLATLLTWKSRQYRRTGAFDALARPWVTEVITRTHATQTEALAGVLSCLYADDELLAAHFGMRSGRVLHSWFPAYDVRYARDSPGLVLLRLLLEEAPAAGIGVLDFGKGDEDYKDRFANGTVELGEGTAETDRLTALRTRLIRASWDRALRSRLYRPVNHVRRRIDFR